MTIQAIKTKQLELEKIAFTTGNVEVFKELFDADIVYHEPPMPPIIGMNAFLQTMTGFFMGLTDLHYEIREFMCEGDMTAELFEFRFRHIGPNPLIPVPPSGKEFVYAGLMLAKWKNGKIVEAYNYADMLGMYQALGIIPAPSMP